MKKRGILIFLCILPSLIGLVCFGLYFFQEDHNRLLLSAGIFCCALTNIVSCIYQRNQRKKKP